MDFYRFMNKKEKINWNEAFGVKVTITEPIIFNDGTSFEDYVSEENLHYLGLSLLKEKEDEK